MEWPQAPVVLKSRLRLIGAGGSLGRQLQGCGHGREFQISAGELFEIREKVRSAWPHRHDAGVARVTWKGG